MCVVCINADCQARSGAEWSRELGLGRHHFFHIGAEFLPILVVHGFAFGVVRTGGINHDATFLELLQVDKQADHAVEVTSARLHGETAEGNHCAGNVKATKGD